MQIELLYFDGCPSYKRAEQLLNEALAEMQTEAEVLKKNIINDDMATAERFLGSPSIRIDGVDVDPVVRTSTDFGLKCRIYQIDQGIRGWPSKHMIKQAIQKAGS